MKIAGLKRASDTPKGFPEEGKEQEAYLDQLSQKVVNKIFLEPEGMAEVINSASETPQDYCICKDGKWNKCRYICISVDKILNKM